MATKGQRHLNSFANDEFDPETYRKRVATHIDGNTISYEDGTFSSSDSPAIFDVESDLGRIGTGGYFINDGPGDIKVEISYDGLAYGGQHTLRGGDQLSLKDLKIRKMRLTYVDATEYRALIG